LTFVENPGIFMKLKLNSMKNQVKISFMEAFGTEKDAAEMKVKYIKDMNNEENALMKEHNDVLEGKQKILIKRILPLEALNA
jgi:delta-aminolevulinic acid dehydratase/porphobilinogen synthase